jgi:hypothetical protein
MALLTTRSGRLTRSRAVLCSRSPSAVSAEGAPLIAPKSIPDPRWQSAPYRRLRDRRGGPQIDRPQRFLLWYDLAVTVRKWSVSIDEELAERVEEHVGGRGLSGFVARAVEHELERDALGTYLDDLDSGFGSVASDLVEEYDRLWP